ncbi:MAG: hypothetical protein C4529_15060 [Deltaproteobacteria bacterium]|nr:MAG: hypothetical protein C4529_15060 [Deltaproteobacteria bacterium]
MTMIRMIGKAFSIEQPARLFLMHDRLHLWPQRCSAKQTRVSLRTRLAAFLGRVTIPTPWRKLRAK